MNLAKIALPISVVFLMIAGCAMPTLAAEEAIKVPAPAKSFEQNEDAATTVLAGGCFWCIEGVFEDLNGVSDVTSGFAGDGKANADYQTVSAGGTKHAEAVKITYDPKVISYGTLLQVYFTAIDATVGNGQKPDFGPQYRPAIFYADDTQKAFVDAYIKQLNDAKVFDKPIAVHVEPLGQGFFPAEDYHQDYVKHHPNQPYVTQWSVPKIEKVRKAFPELHKGAAADAGGAKDKVGRVEKTEAQWRAQLTPDQFHILREGGTEAPFSSKLLKEKREGTFACVACDLPLFRSEAKFESGTGWPSFTSAIDGHVLKTPDDGSSGAELKCARCLGHLGDVFNDGPKPTGKRFCINGVALTFEPT